MTHPPPPAELDDVTLARAQRGEEAACLALVRRYERPVFALLSRLVGRRGHELLVEDLAQEAFLRVFAALPRFVHDGRATLSTWILTVALRVALSELRRRRPVVAPLDPELPAAARAEETRDLAARIERALATLSVEQRGAFLLREYHGLSYEEIARALDLPVGTVRSRLARAKQGLRAALHEDEP
jgi:RNA polymerase sigma-70 factor (ECF subfamily)